MLEWREVEAREQKKKKKIGNNKAGVHITSLAYRTLYSLLLLLRLRPNHNHHQTHKLLSQRERRSSFMALPP